MKQKILSYGIALCATGVAQAIELPEIIGNDMVLQQQQKNAKLWGWAKPGNYVTITTGWNKECYQVKREATRMFPCLGLPWCGRHQKCTLLLPQLRHRPVAQPARTARRSLYHRKISPSPLIHERHEHQVS